MSLELSLTVPVIHVWGKYRVNGDVFILRVDGDGPFTTTLVGLTGIGSASIVPVGRPGNKKLSIRNTNIDFNIESASVHMENLFDGKLPALADTVNDFINKNSQLIINEVKPQIREEVTNLVDSVLNDAFSKLPAEEILAQIPIPRSIPPRIRSRTSRRRRKSVAAAARVLRS